MVNGRLAGAEILGDEEEPQAADNPCAGAREEREDLNGIGKIQYDALNLPHHGKYAARNVRKEWK